MIPENKILNDQTSILLSYILIALLCVLAIRSEFAYIEETNLHLARERGNVLFRLVELARDWNAQHGGVYVAVNEQTQPNPYLSHPRRDLRTEEGDLLTMINPAFMTREIAEIAEKADGVRLHITSLKPMRPQNAADSWESEALQLFAEKQATERLALFYDGEHAYYRYMAPLFVKAACLQCHEKQGYKLGDVRGGISVSIPANAQLAIRDQQKQRVFWSYAAVALIIALLLHFVIRRTGQLIGNLRQLANDQEKLVSERTANLTESNQLLKAEILERERIAARLKIAAAAVDSVSEGIFVTDHQNRIIEVNPGFCAITGYHPVEVLGKNPRLLASGRHGADFYQQIWQQLSDRGRWEGEIWNRKKDGTVYPQWLSIASISDGGSADSGGKYVATFSDITQRKEAEELLKHKAQSDPLTGLPNRALFQDRVSMAFNLASRYQELFAVIYLDLDYFKGVNDRLGHDAGDELLIEAARRMSGLVRNADTVARLGGDEFAIVLPKLSSTGEGEEIAARIVKALAEPFLLTADTVHISCSAGVAFYPGRAKDVQQMIQDADQALYEVKRLGRNGYRIAGAG